MSEKPRDVKLKYDEIDAAIFLEEMKAKMGVLLQYSFSEQKPLSFFQEQMIAAVNECNQKHKVFKNE